MTDQRRQKYGNRNDFRRENGLGDEVRLVEQAGSGPLNSVAEQEPRQHPGEYEKRITTDTGRRFLVQTDLENERPNDQKDERMDEAPDPPDGGADEALFEVAADHLKEQTSPLNQIPQK